MSIKIRLFFILLLLFFFSASVISQDQTYRLHSDRIGGAGLSFEFWKAKKDQVTQFAFPFSYIYPYNKKIRFFAVTSPAFTGLNTGGSYGLGGLSDIKLGGHIWTLNDGVLITFGLNLPTGNHKLDGEEYAVASVLSMPAFNFRVPSLGQGLDIQLGANTAWEMGDFVVGYGISYLKKGGFKAYEGQSKIYNPGDEITISWGIQKREVFMFGRNMDIKADILYTGYASDEWGDEKVFSSGNRFIVQVLSQFKVDPVDVVVLIRDRIKEKNSTATEGFLNTERKNRNGSQFEILGIGYYPYARNIRLKGIFDFKLYSNNDYDTGGATLFGFGGGGQMRLTPQIVLNGDLRFYLGSIKTGAERVFTFGLKLFGGIQYTFQ
jgi:hypothetical protein